MDFKPAICPSCGGKLQLPENLTNVNCMYCGVDVVVQDAIKLSGRVKEFTQAEPIKKVTEWKTDFSKAHNQTFTLAAVVGIFGLLVAFCVGSSNRAFGYSIGIATIVIVGLLFLLRTNTINKQRQAIEGMKDKDSPVRSLIGYKGQCPYCDSTITLKPNSMGDNCPACHKRIVIRDSRFYSVDTPISGLK